MLACARLVLLLLTVSACALAQAQRPPAAGEAAAVYAPATGDGWIDRQLDDINAYARRYPDSFLDELVRYANVRRGYVQALLERQHLVPGDIYFACAWAFATNLSCRETVRAWNLDRGAGWATALAKLPIAPDTLHYRAVRHAIVASYDRWDRPIRLDPMLQRQLGDRTQRLERARQGAQAEAAADAQRL